MQSISFWIDLPREAGGGWRKDERELTFDSRFDLREIRVLSVHSREIDRRRRELVRREDGRWCGGEHPLDAMMVVWWKNQEKGDVVSSCVIFRLLPSLRGSRVLGLTEEDEKHEMEDVRS